MTHKIINPRSLGAPKGYSNGVLAEVGGRLLLVAGQIGWDAEQNLVGDGLAAQFGRALANVLTVVREAGGTAEDVGRLTIFVADRHEYEGALEEVGVAYREVMGRHYPAMSLVEVQVLLEPGAKVEIEATAVLP